VSAEEEEIWAKEEEISMSGKKTLIALSAALVLGALGAAAQAGDNSGDYKGGFVAPGSSAVNPAYHARWFGKGGKAYAFVPSTKQMHRAPQAAHQKDNYGPEAGKD
jgi:hypothetical protein